MSRQSIPGYDAKANELSEQYESLEFSRVHAWLLPLLPETRGLALDVGAGSGRDAKGLLELGYEVVAAEPSSRMRAEGQRRHPDSGILWVDEALPGLDSLIRQGLSFDLILLSAVWMHISPEDRPRSFRKLVSLLRPGGILAMTLRQGPPEPGRQMYKTSAGEPEGFAKAHGMAFLHANEASDHLGRPGITWIHVAFRLPDDETGALPLLRHVILKSDKSSTYKLGLLRAIARIADGSQGMAVHRGEETVSLPLGLVGLFWIRLYRPLVREGLPQTPSHDGTTEGLGFVGESWGSLTHLSSQELRPGSQIPVQWSPAFHHALRDAVRTIVRMPAHFMTFPGTRDPVFKALTTRTGRLTGPLFLDEAYLRSFGELLIPVHLWRALSRFDVWIEPALTGEWTRLMESYLARQGKTIDFGKIADAMRWSEPLRDVSLVKKMARPLLERHRLFCVWSGRRLTDRTFDVDHCFPWSAWPCDDLWNLFPSHRGVNRQKSARIPSARALSEAEDRMMEWWSRAYSESDNPSLKRRFFVEARGTLSLETGGNPGGEDSGIPLEQIVAGMSFRRLSLRVDQGIEEWEGIREPKGPPRGALLSGRSGDVRKP